MTNHSSIGKGSEHRAINGGLDQYFTPRLVADQLIKETLKYAPNGSEWIEPSAGAGVFKRASKLHKINLKCYDLEPLFKYVKKQDFLHYQHVGKKPVVVIGNPPFGFAASLAVKFFNHASLFADVISFVVPASFCKASIQNKLNTRFELVWSEKEIIAFEFPDGGTKKVPCVKQIWKRLPEMQHRKLFEEDYGKDLLTFVKPDAPINKKMYYVAIRRVGGRAGQIVEGGSKGTTYFILCNERVYQAIKKADFTKTVNDTVGVKSLSIPELIGAIREQL